MPNCSRRSAAWPTRTGPPPTVSASAGCSRLRHFAGVRMLGGNGHRPGSPQPDHAGLPPAGSLPEFTPDELTPELLRAAILRDGCVLVRGLVDRDAALDFAAQIDRSFAERERFVLEQGEPEPGYYEEFAPVLGHEFQPGQRAWIREGGGVLAADAPMLTAQMLELFGDADLRTAGRGLPGRAPPDLGPEDNSAQGRAHRAAAPGTKTAPSWVM